MSIDEIRSLCRDGAFRWTTHITMRLQERGINPSDIRHCILMGDIIEAYPHDYPFPSYLMLGQTKSGKPLHTVIGVGDGMLWLVTAYRPGVDKWEDDLKTRKVK